MELKIIHDKATIYDFLKNNPGFQLYLIGDLDDFFWPKTIWYALSEENDLKSLALLYAGLDIPTLLLFHDGDSFPSIQLLRKIRNYLPEKFYAHLSIGLLDIFGRNNVINYYGLNYKMVLTKTITNIDDKNIRILSTKDLPIINDFYSTAYPQNWFDNRMLETNKYFGYFVNEKLIGVSGIHVYSENYKVAALGNIAVHPDYRGQQIGFKLTSALCYDLQNKVDIIGLNVRSDNAIAINCYKKIGFEIIGDYDDCLIKNGS